MTDRINSIEELAAMCSEDVKAETQRRNPDIFGQTATTPAKRATSQNGAGTGRKPIQQTEAQFQAAVIGCAEIHHWKSYHTHDSRRSASGFPDLCLVRERVVYAELKRSRKEKVSPEQQEWLTVLRNAGQAAYLWNPEMWDEIEVILE